MSPTPQHTYVIADIHGCLEPLQALLALIRPEPEDQLVFLGDYVDRGPDSRGVIALLLELPGAPVFLKGNHDDLLLRALANDEDAIRTWLYNGGFATIESYGGISRIPPAHLAFLRRLRLYHETPEALCVHAGLQPGIPLAEQPEDALLWIREPFLHYEGTWPTPIVAGHTIQREAVICPDRMLIDTGCFKGGPLTAIRLTDRRLFQVPGQKRVAPSWQPIQLSA